ncbi:hypothetical protein SPBR_08955 [Sporothrix brasiliensis 5110]|uniref:Uncharacterized protein n=1 Tax=Sporothrix brasiliensis 5110 TaxID=1398154 RepID=A0A0C2ID95_9PEZI|nr:uncharacterized protein SPBR_08955 [Sporothrix brasiliensis 5110]KIH87241.1 hypothetical protein SPBR_08955 [Sporothrix brasiliensis 5110]
MAKKNKNKGIASKLWEEYYNEDELGHWQRLLSVLGIDGHFSSKTQCKKALRGVWVNIRDFLQAAAADKTVPRHRNRRALAYYTETTGRYFARSRIVSGSPLAALMATID